MDDLHASPAESPASFWESRYSNAPRVWSGRVNQVLADVAAPLPPGRALDLGCGEGADAIWLAQQGWNATGMDISATAIARARAAAAHAAAGGAHYLVSDLSQLPSGVYDLVSASYFHSPVELARVEILRRASALVAPGGHLLVTSHADFPPWAEKPHHDHHFLNPQEEIDQLELEPGQWEIELAETRPRQATGPQGERATLDDVVVLIRRR
ncbi:class I SAM-dependent methyltransferase [Bogoriella caseilytica]|uniref:Chemotaxis protein methyltransferase CheR n=1 Tax=Bogoriella caseilytica TaxID=56055 RepID=A0A3N2BF96_9MICO|nr:class I SAM-dependent methyltransferase [Bogoriella caseilytica]ROR73714.1 chemotaxis protein methyltransferase CheR [Bogoriella caseilytica]